MQSDLTTIVYVSTATASMSDEQLEELLVQARARNAEEGITGLLLYCEGNFMQCIEGQRLPLRSVYASILRDPRHRGIIELTQHRIEKREFAQWSMAFSHDDPNQKSLLRNYDRQARTIRGASELSTTQLLVEFWREQMGLSRMPADYFS